jgi:hypothetical protein
MVYSKKSNCECASRLADSCIRGIGGSSHWRATTFTFVTVGARGFQPPTPSLVSQAEAKHGKNYAFLETV